MPLITDRDLLLIEPTAFTAAAAAATNIITVADAAVSGTTLSSATSDFAAAGVDAAHVAVFDGDALEIVSRLSATQLDISRPRASIDDEKIAPPAGSNKTLKINSFARLIDRTQKELLWSLGMHADDPVQPLNADNIINSLALKQAIALRVLAQAFAAASAIDLDSDSLLARSLLYGARGLAAVASLYVHVDLDGDGTADEKRYLNAATLRRV